VNSGLGEEGKAPCLPLVWSGVTVLVSLIVTTALFALLYRVLPERASAQAAM
jgi:uncharacterized BrkB/YihY/UPF0761 family membrane protein